MFNLKIKTIVIKARYHFGLIGLEKIKNTVNIQF